MSTSNPAHRKSLGFFPTPLTDLTSITRTLGGPRVMIKRDDLTGLGFGGNKTRKLEYLIGDAIALGCDVIVTGGAEQSNHCRQTAAACAYCGLECHLVLGGNAPDSLQGNLLLDSLLGAQIHWAGKNRKGETIPSIVAELRSANKKPYVIPYGGSNEIGAFGFVEAVSELQLQMAAQSVQISHIVFPSSSGGTQAGLVVGKILQKQAYTLIGIEIDKGETSASSFREHVQALTAATAKRLNVSIKDIASEIHLRNEYLGEGYAVIGTLEREAISLLAQSEGIFLDPVYTGRAFGGLLSMIRKGEFDSSDCILFWHTGGTPALFSYADVLTPSGK